MIVPEVILYSFIKSCFKVTIDDMTANAADQTKSLLYQLFQQDDNNDIIKLESYVFYPQAKNLLTRTDEKTRKADVFFGYNLLRKGLPSIHIILSSENSGRYDNIGDQSDINNVFDVVNQKIIINKQSTYQPMYSLLLSGDNNAEILILFEWLRAMLIIFKDHLELKGLKNIKVSAADITLQADLVPQNIYHRNINLQFDYACNFKFTIPAQLSNNLHLSMCDNMGDDYSAYINQVIT